MIQKHSIMLNRKENVRDRLCFHDGAVPYFSIPSFDALGIKNGFSTRFGGVSTGAYAEMNLAALKEPKDVIFENYRRMCETLHMNVNRAVLSYQTHTVHVRTVQESDLGKGPVFDRDYIDVDGLITDMPDVPLVTLYADCVPLYFYDPVHHAIGLSHSGWRGTAGRIGAVTLQRMHEEFDTREEDVLAAIGPSICKDCYEVSEDVASVFRSEFGAFRFEKMAEEKEDGKYLLDLWEANRTVLLSAGVPKENIFTTDICTKCNSELLFSHRVLGSARGTMGAFLSL